MKNCQNCSERCKRADYIHELAEGRMYSTKAFIEAQRKVDEYERKISEGKLVEIPLKIGDVVYAIRNFRGIEHVQKTEVSEMFFTQDMRLMIVCRYVARGEYGKTVFQTMHEAQAEIDKRKSSDGLKWS